MEKSESIKEISGALFEFHKIMGKVGKDAKNPFFKSNYATLPAIQEAVKEPLEKAGLVYAQFPDGLHGLTTFLVHPESGEWLAAQYEMTPAKVDPQGQGSVITYQRRYALGAILGLTIDEDDDGNSGSTQKTIGRTKVPYPESNDEAPPFV